MEWLQALDGNLFLNLNSYRSAWGDSFFLLFSGKLIWIPMYAAMLFALFRYLRWQQALILVLGVALLITCTDQFCSHLLRPIFARPRPGNPVSDIFSQVFLAPGYNPRGNGFPSCHAANTMALAMFFSLIFRRRPLVIFLFLWALVTCYSRIYLAAHYPGDLLIGSLIGILFAWIIYGLASWLTEIATKSRLPRREYPVRCKIWGRRTINLYCSNVVIIVGLLTILYMIIVSL